MGGGKESAVVKNTGALDYWEATLREVRLNGHPYIDLRKVGENNIFFCVLCHAECVSEPFLNAHLKGRFHQQRHAGAKLTLFGPNPWPFSDGGIFYTTLCENDVQSVEVMPSIGGAGLVDSKPSNGGKVAVVSKRSSNGHDTVSNPKEKGDPLHMERYELMKLAAIHRKLFNDKLKFIEPRKAWMENPEDLEQCSTGLHFSFDSSVRKWCCL